MSDPLLRAEALVKEYDKGRARVEVLRSCGLAVAPGEFVAIRGASGSGKSTLLHILGALDVPQSGQVYFEGRPVFAPPVYRRLNTHAFDVLSSYERRRIALRRHAFGFVFQFYHLLPELNVLENVLMSRMVGCSTWAWIRRGRAARSDALAIVERVGLKDRVRHRPSELSGGERQRVAIARALAHKPKVLLADEPTGNLDAKTGGKLLELINQLNAEGQTTVMVTHDPAVAAHAHRRLLLEAGTLRTE